MIQSKCWESTKRTCPFGLGLTFGCPLTRPHENAGESSLFSGERRPKDDVVFDALGAVDELNAAVGVAREACALVDSVECAGSRLEGGEDKDALVAPDLDAVLDQLVEVQSRLLDVGSAVATPRPDGSDSQAGDAARLELTAFGSDHALVVESWIDDHDKSLPPLTAFILPSGGPAAAALHMARTICRRAERGVVPLVRAKAVESNVGQYLNRLSDYLFTAARVASRAAGADEVVYKKARDRSRRQQRRQRAQDSD